VVILGVKAQGWQGIESQEYLNIPAILHRSRPGCTGGRHDKLFLSEP
jgi:hypothetical protein